MSYPKNELAQLVIAYCAAYQIEDVVISPGSRNAPLTIGFTNHPDINTYSIADERSAAFFALGLAQQKRKPTVVVCTSGSALLNYYPAYAEAFYSDIPLVVLSADRPKHLIDIGDGQTIRQENVFKNHSLFNANLVDHKEYTSANASLIEEALLAAINQKGPVHINLPFDEPLYETVAKLSYEIFPEKKIKKDTSLKDLQEYAAVWNSAQCKMVIVGSNYPDKELQKLIHHFAEDESVIILTETISNLHHSNFINSIDKILMPLKEDDFEKLQPDILLSFGGMVVSKKIKQFLRKFQPKHHWHIDPKRVLDTYLCLSRHFKTSAVNFFKQFIPLSKKVTSSYQQEWLQLKNSRIEKHDKYFSEIEFSDLKVFNIILSSLRNNVQLQLGNSSVVRYAQLFDLKKTLKVFCNRGTSGIDGSTSTAIGASLPNEEQTVFITGDIGFFYDSNALWNDYIKSDFRIILINNSGGGIFRFIPGPKSTNVLDYFESPHHLNAEFLCKMFHVDYRFASDEKQLNEQLKDFYKKGDRPILLEIQTPREQNDTILKEYFKFLE